MSKDNERGLAAPTPNDQPLAGGFVRPVVGKNVLPGGLTGVIRDIPPASVVLGRLRGLRKVGA